MKPDPHTAHFNADASLVPPRERILAAVSSGADSLALLWWLREIGADVVVGHVNHDLHELRGGACAVDEAFVRQKCAEIGVSFVSKTVDLPRKNGHVNEVVAREARYLALAQMAREVGAKFVATGHTASDALESAILNLTRGAGPNGWMGIAPSRVLDGEIHLVRPLWRVPRSSTKAMLQNVGWNWREDESNVDERFRRNRVRAEVLPLLEAISGKDEAQLALEFARGALISREEGAWMESEAVRLLKSAVKKREPNAISLDGALLQTWPNAMQRRVIRLAAREIAPDVRDLSWEKVETVRLAIMENQKRAVWTWRADLRVEWTGTACGNRLRVWRV